MKIAVRTAALVHGLVVVCCFGAALQVLHASEYVWTWDGADPVGRFGSAVAVGGDADGDGFSDVVVGAPYENGFNGTDCGRVHVFSGRTGELVWSRGGEQSTSLLGFSVSFAGDVDGDGRDDVVAGAPLHSGPGGAESGSAYLFSGATGGTIWTWEGEEPDARFGWAVAGLGDVDGDEVSDLAVVAPSQSGGPEGRQVGRLYVYSGLTRALHWSVEARTPVACDEASVAGVGDVDADGVGDVALGVPNFCDGKRLGEVHVFSGIDGYRIWTRLGEGNTDRFGQAVSGAGDVDLDGHGDVLVGAPYQDDSNGKAYLLSGLDGHLLAPFYSTQQDALLGWSVAGIGDVNRDGHPDVAIGAPNHLQHGAVNVCSGATFELLGSWEGEVSGDYFGYAISGSWEGHRDELADLVVGALQHDTPSSDAGRAYGISVAERVGSRCREGNVNARHGVVADVLFVNGSAGDQLRIVRAAEGEAFELRLATPPTGPATSRFVIWVWPGFASKPVDLAIGEIGIGCLAAPTPFHAPLQPQPMLCVRGGLPAVVCGSASEPPRRPNRAPWSLRRSAGFGSGASFTFQGLPRDAGSANESGFSVTNAATLLVE